MASRLGTLNFEHMNPMKYFECVEPNLPIQFTLPGWFLPNKNSPWPQWLPGLSSSQAAWKRMRGRGSFFVSEKGWVLHGIHNDDPTFLTVTDLKKNVWQKQTNFQTPPFFGGNFSRKNKVLTEFSLQFGCVGVVNRPFPPLTHPLGLSGCTAAVWAFQCLYDDLCS